MNAVLCRDRPFHRNDSDIIVKTTAKANSQKQVKNYRFSQFALVDVVDIERRYEENDAGSRRTLF